MYEPQLGLYLFKNSKGIVFCIQNCSFFCNLYLTFFVIHVKIIVYERRQNMSIVKKYSKTVMGLSALGLASVTQIAHADSQVESYPEELDKLITEAKSLGIAVVEEPTKTVANDDDLKTHYDKLTNQLRELITSYKSAKSDNDKATAVYEKAEAEYQKALASYEEAKKSYNEQVIEGQRCS